MGGGFYMENRQPLILVMECEKEGLQEAKRQMSCCAPAGLQHYDDLVFFQLLLLV